MKILFVQKVKAFAGSEKYLTEIIPALNDRGYTCNFLFVIHPDDREKLSHFLAVLKEKKIKYECVESKRDLGYTLLRKLHKSANTIPYDLIHLNLIHAELWFSLIARFFRFKTPLVSTIHGFDENYQASFGFDPHHVSNTKYIRILKFCQKQIASYFAVSEGLRKLVVEGKIIPSSKIKVINYGFDYPSVDIIPTAQPNVKHILVPGRLVPYKGQDMVVDILPKLKELGHTFKIWIAGDPQGPFGEALKERVKKLNLTSEVDFLGHVSNIQDYYASCDLVILPSKSEGFGLVLLEAFNFEKPVITFDVPAFNETIIHEETGIITPAFDLNQLTKNVDRLLNEPDLCKKLTKAAKVRLLEYYCLERMVNETVAFYEETRQKLI